MNEESTKREQCQEHSKEGGAIYLTCLIFLTPIWTFLRNLNLNQRNFFFHSFFFFPSSFFYELCCLKGFFLFN